MDPYALKGRQNMHDLAKVAVIEKVRPIEGKDRIALARVENYDTIVTKEYREGDRVVYVFYDAVLPSSNPEFEFLRKRCYRGKLDGYHIRPMKMGGVISEGLVLPLSVLPPGKEYKVGDIVTEDLGIRPYIVPEESGKTKKVGTYPPLVPRADEDNIESLSGCWNDWKELEFYVTEKVEGTAGTWIYRKEDDSFHTYSHNWEVDGGVWCDAAANIALREKMKEYVIKSGLEGIVLQGEVVGPGVQKNIYHLAKADVYFYGAMDMNGRRYDFNALCASLGEMELKMVPLVNDRAYLPDNIDTILRDSVGKSLIDPSVPREGLVWRVKTGERSVHFKVKSRPYKVWFEDR